MSLWRAWRGREIAIPTGTTVLTLPMGGALPEPGGMLDQVPCVMASLRVIDGAWETVKPRD